MMRPRLATMLLTLTTACGAVTVRGDEDPPDADAALPASDATLPTPDAITADAITTDAASPDARDALLHLRAIMVGTWEGTAEAPPTWTPSRWSVQISFAADGRYEAACTAGACAPFYYDAPGPDARRTWTLDDVLASGDATGTLTVVFPGGGAQRGELARVRYDTALTFDFWNTWAAGRLGPIRYTLRRVR